LILQAELTSQLATTTTLRPAASADVVLNLRLDYCQLFDGNTAVYPN
jgi:hypothetical protein